MGGGVNLGVERAGTGRARSGVRCAPLRTCEYTDTTRRGQPKALVALKVTSMGKFHTTDASPPLLLRATCEKPWSMPWHTRQSGPCEKE
jgi:hypothetical protein